MELLADPHLSASCLDLPPESEGNLGPSCMSAGGSAGSRRYSVAALPVTKTGKCLNHSIARLIIWPPPCLVKGNRTNCQLTCTSVPNLPPGGHCTS